MFDTVAMRASIVAVLMMGGTALAITDPICKAADYRTGAEFDISTFVNKRVKVGDHNYDISPCGIKGDSMTTDPKCGFACQIEAGGSMTLRSLGNQVYRDMIQPVVTSDGSTPLGVKMLIRNGDVCAAKSGQKAQARGIDVHYFCHDSDEDVIEVTEDFRCEYTLFAYTKKACPKMPAAASVSNNPCTFTSKKDSSKHFDFSPLRKLHGNHVVNSIDAYDDQKFSHMYEFVINVCQPVNFNPDLAHQNALDGCHVEDAHVGVCQIDYVRTTSDSGPSVKPVFYMLGQVMDNDHKHYMIDEDADGTLFIHYKGGTPYRGSVERSTRINFHCLEGSGVGRPELVREDYATGTYYFEWITEHACPVTTHSKAMSAGSVFALIVFVIVPLIVLLYCLVGMFFNKQNGKSGLEMVPHIDLLRSLPCCSGTGIGLSIKAEEEEHGASLMDDDYE